MKAINVQDLFDKKINKIWKSSEYINSLTKPVIARNYWLERTLIKKSILFIGINPSFAGGKIFNENYYDTKLEGNFYQKYHNKFEEIYRNTNIEWSHHDLLFFRETKQKYCEKIEKSPEGSSFIQAQLTLSKEIIELAKPRIIVVTNTTARRYMGKYSEDKWNFGFEYKFSDVLGTDIIISKDSELNNTPVFFTSMLTGQRALDKGSFERLVWHIKMVNNKIS